MLDLDVDGMERKPGASEGKKQWQQLAKGSGDGAVRMVVVDLRLECRWNLWWSPASETRNALL